MRVLVETLDSVIEGEVIGGDLLDGIAVASILSRSSRFGVTTADLFRFTDGWSMLRCFKTRQSG